MCEDIIMYCEWASMVEVVLCVHVWKLVQVKATCATPFNLLHVSSYQICLYDVRIIIVRSQVPATLC